MSRTLIGDEELSEAVLDKLKTRPLTATDIEEALQRVADEVARKMDEYICEQLTNTIEGSIRTHLGKAQRASTR